MESPSKQVAWGEEKIVVTTKLDSLMELDNKWTWAIDFWFSRVKEGYIVEFVIEYSDSFSKAERVLKKVQERRC